MDGSAGLDALTRRQCIARALGLAAGSALAGPAFGQAGAPAARSPYPFGLPGPALSRSRTLGDNPVVAENLRRGTTAWRPNRYRFDIEGFGSATSVAAGEQLRIFVQSHGAAFDLDVYRTGYYGGTGGRLVASAKGLEGRRQSSPRHDPATGLASCSHWSPSHVLAIPDDWVSGIYVAKLTRRDTGGETFVLFVVRDERRTAPIRYQQSVTTYQAYNGYGGKSLYSHIATNTCPTVSGAPRAVKVSFDRPYNAPLEDPSQYLRAEFPMVYWLEANGYDVSYTTNLDTHRSGVAGNRNRLLDCRTFLSVGHDEYWSAEMRAAVTAARDHGVHLGVFSANTCYWRVRFEPDPWSGEADRTLVCYKTTESGVADPSGQPTTTWRDPDGANAPENALLGVMCIGDNDRLGFPIRVGAEAAAHPAFRHTGVRGLGEAEQADLGAELVGWEWDAVVDNGHSPANLTILARSPVFGALFRSSRDPARRTLTRGEVHTTSYVAPSGAHVFACGTIQWAWGLALVTPDPVIQQMTCNVLADMGVMPATPIDTLILDGAMTSPLGVTPVGTAAAPPPPQVTHQVAAGDRQLTVRWETSSPARVQLWFEAADGLIDAVHAAPGVAARSGVQIIDGLEPATRYTVWLVAWSDGGAPWIGPPTQVATEAASWATAPRLGLEAALHPAMCRARPAALTARDWLRGTGARAVGLGVGALILGSWWRRRGLKQQTAVPQLGTRASESPLE